MVLVVLILEVWFDGFESLPKQLLVSGHEGHPTAAFKKALSWSKHACTMGLTQLF